MASLKSSKLMTYECKLRRVEQALHDTVQRFVENLPSPNGKGMNADPRISQYADVAFAAKLMERDQWFWLRPMLGGRSGYLLFLPDLPAIWLDEQMKQAYKIPMRVSQSVYEKGSVFLASLDRTDGLLRLEDCWQLTGKLLRTQTFTQRWKNLCQFYDEMFCEDDILQQGLRIQMAEYDALESALHWSPLPHMMLAQGEKSHRRLRVQCGGEMPTTPAKRSEVPRGLGGGPTTPKPFAHSSVRVLQRPHVSSSNGPVKTSLLPTPSSVTKESSGSSCVENPGFARAVAHDIYPDTYDLWQGAKKLGFAAVQDLTLSRQLRDGMGKQAKKELMVRIAWNEEFGMNEIVGLE
jgi:hypothetical protein